MFNAGVIAARSSLVFPTFVSSTTGGSSTTNSMSLAEPAGAQDDDILVACAWAYDDAGAFINTPSGWTQLYSSGAAVNFLGMWGRRRSGASGSTLIEVTTPTGPQMAIHGSILCFRGVAPALSISSAVENRSTSSTAVVTSGPNRLATLVGFYVGGATNPPTGWTEIIDTASPIRRTSAEVKNAPSAGTYTSTGRSGATLANSFSFAIRAS